MGKVPAHGSRLLSGEGCGRRRAFSADPRLPKTAGHSAYSAHVPGLSLHSEGRGAPLPELSSRRHVQQTAAIDQAQVVVEGLLPLLPGGWVGGCGDPQAQPQLLQVSVPGSEGFQVLRPGIPWRLASLCSWVEVSDSWLVSGSGGSGTTSGTFWHRLSTRYDVGR